MATKRRARVQEDERKQRRASPPNRPTISVIGAGRLGTALALALNDCGYHVEAMVARRKAHARRSSQLIPSKPLALSSKELNQLPLSDLLFITTPDDAISEAASAIAAQIGERKTTKSAQHRTALHTSGALSSDELKSLRAVGFHTGSMHPLVAVSEARTGAESLSRAFFCIEGESSATRVARRIVRDLGARAFSVRTKEKALYHAAAVTASGHVVALLDIAYEMLSRCGLSPKEARVILMPLLQSTLDNLATHEPARALTGTFARADLSTVRRHLDAIGKEKLPDALAAYTLLGERSLKLAEQRGADANNLRAILKALLASEGKGKKAKVDKA